MHPYRVDTPERVETFAQLIARLKDAYDGISESEIARRLDVSIATVNNWALGRRHSPRPATLRKLAAEFPKISEADVFAAAGRRTPGPVSPDAEVRLLTYFAELTKEQQRAKLVEMKALAEDNRSALS